MNAAVGTTIRTSDPLGVVAALCGAAGFVTTEARLPTIGGSRYLCVGHPV